MSGKNLEHILRFFFLWRVGHFEWSIHLFAVFSSLVRHINLILHILIILNGLNNLAVIRLMLDHSKVRKCIFEWSKRQKIAKLTFWRFQLPLDFHWNPSHWWWLLNMLFLSSKRFSQPRVGLGGGYSENSRFTVQNIQESGIFWQFFKFRWKPRHRQQK